MYNDTLLQEFLHKYGVNKSITFCEMESEKYSKTLESKVFTDPIDHMEMQYERDWWSEHADRLKNNEPC